MRVSEGSGGAAVRGAGGAPFWWVGTTESFFFFFQVLWKEPYSARHVPRAVWTVAVRCVSLDVGVLFVGRQVDKIE